jgi:hypothetical protein
MLGGTTQGGKMSVQTLNNTIVHLPHPVVARLYNLPVVAFLAYAVANGCEVIDNRRVRVDSDEQLARLTAWLKMNVS